MIVEAGTLDALANLVGDVSELYSVNVKSLTTAAGNATVVLAATVVTNGDPAPGTDPSDDEQFGVATFNDQTDVLSLGLSIPGALTASLDDATVVGYNSNALLLYTNGNGSLNVTNTTSLNAADFAVFSPTPLATGTSLTFTSTGVFNGLLSPLLATDASVIGASGNILVLDFATAALAAQAQTELTAISNAILTDTVEAENVTGVLFPSLASGEQGAADVSNAGNYFISKNYEAVFDTSGGQVDLGAAAGNHLIIASGTGNLVYAGLSGADTVYAGFGNTTLYGIGASLDVFDGAGNDLIVGGTAGNTVTGGEAGELIFGVSTLTYTGGTGSATIIGGGGGNTVTGGSGNILAFASGSMTYTGTGGAATIIGGGKPLDAALGSGGGVVYGSPGGDNVLSTDSSNASILVGGGTGDVITAAGSGADVLVAGGGAETINATAATGNQVIFGGPGADVMSGGAGSNLFVTEGGNATLTGGGTSNSYVFINFGPTTRTDVITDFNPNTDALGLFGYSSLTPTSSIISVNGTNLTLSDGTKIQLLGVTTSLHSYNFF
jgi:Ca2+-binding RTX toxin-like protein